MSPRRPPFRLHTSEAKLLGVCAGLGRSLKVDPTFVRIAVVALPLLTFVTFWQMLLAYLVCAAIGAAASARRRRTMRGASIRDLRDTLGRRDRQLMAIDHHLHSAESDALAREIEALRKEKA